MKIRKSIVLPSALIVYLGIIAYMAFPEYQKNQNHFEYIGTIVATLVIIVVLFIFLRKREKNKLSSRRRKDASFRRR
ncbi:MAG: hypothetical protein ACRCX5_13045 [Bacteroidales bacterium]